MDQVKKDLKTIKKRMYKFNCIHDRDDLFGHLTFVYTKLCKVGQREAFFRFFDQKVYDYIKTKNRSNKKEMLDCNNPNASATMYQEHNTANELGVDDRLAVKEVIGKLNDRERKVIVGLFFEKKNAEDLAMELGISVSNISVIKTGALKHMKRAISK